MTKRTGWVDVDLDGLRKVLRERGMAHLIYELVQNAWDDNVTFVKVVASFDGLEDEAVIDVWDNSPEGFRELADAFTLFKESYKKSDAGKRGRFNAGEKFVLALCEEAEIITTKGRVVFKGDGTRKVYLKQCTQEGTRFSGRVAMSQAEFEDMLASITKLIPPEGTETYINGVLLLGRVPTQTCIASLATVIGDQDGILRTSERKTTLKIYEPLTGEVGTLYEMGIPVVETGDRWHVDVQQKVPLNADRDNVTPAYLRAMRVAVLNVMAPQLTPEEATSTWVKEAAGDSKASTEAVTKVIDLRFGEKRVTWDPSEPEANNLAVAQGYTLIYPNSLGKDEWSNVRRAGASLPAGQVTPSAKPYGEMGTKQPPIPGDKYTDGMRRFEAFARWFFAKVLKRSSSLHTTFVSDVTWPFAATYGSGHLTVNKARVGNVFFEGDVEDRLERWSDLLIHEFGHHFESNHLSEDYYAALTKLGADRPPQCRLGLGAFPGPQQPMVASAGWLPTEK